MSVLLWQYQHCWESPITLHCSITETLLVKINIYIQSDVKLHLFFHYLL
ncbi:hypothetical protein F383_12687 [Gossypium arboreum]|uniref:Uncharacterized protein n=1 Tax=Gossypium arboreum TaxID=29729 RepID=A0A0B0PPG1_GOSAR|nr:hypothetical protein F383_12687 [Gossypium arboreum]